MRVEEMSSAERRARMRKIDERLKECLAAAPKPIAIDLMVEGERLEIVLDETITPFYRICRVMFEELLSAGQSEFIEYLICQGVKREWEKLAALRRRVYEIGSAEMLAEELGIRLDDDERQISAAEAPQTTDPLTDSLHLIQEYWDDGYISTKCPECRGQAVWHPDRHDLICIGSCGHRGEYAQRPGPRAMGGDGQDPSGDVRDGTAEEPRG